MNIHHIPSINLHIEELILHGFAREERFAIGEAFQNELQRLFIEQGLPQALQEASTHHVSQLQADTIVVTPDTRIEAIGKQLARSLYAGLHNNGASRPAQARKDQQ